MNIIATKSTTDYYDVMRLFPYYNIAYSAILQYERCGITTRNLQHKDAKKRAYHNEWYARCIYYGG